MTNKELQTEIIHGSNSELFIELIIPTLNEGQTIGHIIEMSKPYVDKISIIDGNSLDDTVEQAAKMGANIIMQEGKGKGQALRQAFSSSKGDIIVAMDADGSMGPHEIPRFINELQNGSDLVKGSRFMEGGGSEDISSLRGAGNSLFTFLVNLFWNAKFTDLCYGYFALNKKSVSKLSPILVSNDFNVETEIMIKALKLKLKIKEIPSFENKRAHGVSNLNWFWDGLSILNTIIKELFV